MADASVDSLTAPKMQRNTTEAGVTRTVTRASLYVEMSESLQAARGTAFGGSARSLPPVWLDGLDWIRTVDNTVRSWWPAAELTTVERLDEVTQAAWRPQDTGDVVRYAKKIEQWVKSGQALLGEAEDSFDLRAACPACSERWIVRTDALGEHLRVPVLTVTALGCSCQACGHHWDPLYFTNLAAILNDAVGPVVIPE